MLKHAIRALAATAAAVMAPVAADAGVTRFKCQLSSAGDSMTMEFVYDDITGKAHAVGNAGLSDVAPYVGQWAITFLEFCRPVRFSRPRSKSKPGPWSTADTRSCQICSRAKCGARVQGRDARPS